MSILVGIDEVGRGPIAGPVAACALACLDPEAMKIFEGVKESKQLTEKGREKWFALIEKECERKTLRFIVSFQSEEVIDRINIRQATLRAVHTAIERLHVDPASAEVLLDGGLFVPREYLRQRTIIGGDAKESIIAMASIAAKVLRDRRMNELAEVYPEYGFERHKGYGTAAHYEAIRTHGLLSCHRRSFLREFVRD